MEHKDTNAVLISSKSIYSEEHTSRLTIRLMLNGYQYYKVGNTEHIVKSDNYLITNLGQTFRTEFDSEIDLKMMLVAFKPQLAERLLYYLSTPEDKLLDNPFHVPSEKVHFFETTFKHDAKIKSIFMQLGSMILNKVHDEEYVAALYSQLLERMLHNQGLIIKSLEQLKSKKASTRMETFKRVSQAKDYIDSHLNNRLDLQKISKEACLSPYHFLRLFKELFHITPHQYLLQERLKKSLYYLNTSSKTIEDISRRVGFEDASSFGRLFKKWYHVSPSGYRV
jgi:AraC-like DNA-binding protein